MALHRDVADELRRQILSGDLAVGEALPSEARLCQEWGASRGTVRQALATLRAEGLIGGGRGVPPVVRSRQLSQPFESFLSFTRWALMIGRQPGQRTLEVTRRPAQVAVADALGIDEGESVVQLLRLRLLDGEPAMIERASFPIDVGIPLLTADLDTHSIYDTLLAAGVDLSSAHHSFDAVAADETDADLLGVVVGAPLLRERRHAHAASGEVVEFSDDRYRPDLVTFTVVNAQESHPALTRTWSPDADRPAATA
jgi:GntR family transcriptional regulator